MKEAVPMPSTKGQSGAFPRRCPHCGSSRGLFTKAVVIRTLLFDFDDISNPHESVGGDEVVGGIVYYCQDCSRPVMRIDPVDSCIDFA